MPVAYPFPNWIGPADPIRAMTAGSEIGLRESSLRQSAAESANRDALGWAQLQAQQQEAQARLAQSAQQEMTALAFDRQKLDQNEHQFQMDLTMRQKVLDDQHMRATERLALQNAMGQAKLGLQKDAFQLKAEETAQRHQAQQQYTTLRNQAIAGGMTDDEATLYAAQNTPGLQGSLAAAASMMRTQQQYGGKDQEVPRIQDIPGTGSRAVIYGKGLHVVPKLTETPSGPIQGYPVMDESGNPIPGVHVVPGRNGAMHFVRDQKESAADATARALGLNVPRGTSPSAGRIKLVGVRPVGSQPVATAPGQATDGTYGPSADVPQEFQPTLEPPSQRKRPISPVYPPPERPAPEPAPEPDYAPVAPPMEPPERAAAPPQAAAPAPNVDWWKRDVQPAARAERVSPLQMGGAKTELLRDGNERVLKGMDGDQIAVIATEVLGRRVVWDPSKKNFYIRTLPGEGFGPGKAVSRRKMEADLLDRSVDESGGFSYFGE